MTQVMIDQMSKEKSIPHRFLLTQIILILSRRRPLSYRNQSIDLRNKSMDWFLYDNSLRLERVKCGSKEGY